MRPTQQLLRHAIVCGQESVLHHAMIVIVELATGLRTAPPQDTMQCLCCFLTSSQAQHGATSTAAKRRKKKAKKAREDDDDVLDALALEAAAEQAVCWGACLLKTTNRVGTQQDRKTQC
eukprot:3814032-Amphidinium_carterae.1